LAAQWLSRQQRFLDEHILRWVPAHCERLNTVAKTPFYAALALLLGRACLLDRSDLTQVSDWMAQ
jgi:TorA maturation chaperone TorD